MQLLSRKSPSGYPIQSNERPAVPRPTKPSSPDNPSFDKKKIWLVWGGVVVLILAGSWGAIKFKNHSNSKKLIKINNEKRDIPSKEYPIANQGNVSPISGLPCEHWNRRALAVMQPADVQARPAAGFSEADMVIEMPVITASITRLMAIYVCNTPPEVGSMRSARHDFIHLAKGLDAVFVSWGRSEPHGHDPVGLAKGILDRKEIENINCNGDAGTSAYACPENPCFRKNGMSRGVDSGYSHPAKLWECAKALGYRMETKFSGYPHQPEAPMEERPVGGSLRVGFAGPYAVNYKYDQMTNSYKRFWGGKEDTDRNNGQQIAPKNVVVMIASSEQIEGQYNNVQLGDPWYDTSDSGEAYYYFDGKEIKGTWKKDKSRIDSKLLFLDENGNDIKFVPGQIWVEILEPGQGLKWRVEEN